MKFLTWIAELFSGRKWIMVASKKLNSSIGESMWIHLYESQDGKRKVQVYNPDHLRFKESTYHNQIVLPWLSGRNFTDIPTYQSAINNDLVAALMKD